ncbi:hypothetical protein GCM10010964_39890 [Caldovatus sediminis]|uniref:Uncharacterized protein n=1 Tax=Caldovatus sediminis TaxID=2041189 RepID=A0A8J2ZEI0_9PROT|nr:hypothetical protein [Caldovatus sediminis]GGG48564.1 hypothetical protein GCM10010964_39890 [Caldovatus sediminis]
MYIRRRVVGRQDLPVHAEIGDVVDPVVRQPAPPLLHRGGRLLHLAEVAAEGELPLVVEALLAREDQHGVAVHRRLDRPHRLRRERAGEVEALRARGEHRGQGRQAQSPATPGFRRRSGRADPPVGHRRSSSPTRAPGPLARGPGPIPTGMAAVPAEGHKRPARARIPRALVPPRTRRYVTGAMADPRPPA